MNKTLAIQVIGVSLVASAGVGAQDAPRALWDADFLKQRPPAAFPENPGRTAVTPVYRKAKPAPRITSQTSKPVSGTPVPVYPESNPTERTPIPAVVGTTEAPARSAGLLGLTFWRLRPPRGSAENNRLLIQQAAGQANLALVPERVPAETALLEGERIRLSVESPREGYLYIVDQELYSDGSVGDPFLIFPAGNLMRGENKVIPGRLIDVPSQSDPVPALEVSRRRSDHGGERLTIIVSPTPLVGVAPEKRESALSPALFAKWEVAWLGETESYELVNQPSQIWTKAEQEAGGDQKRLLRQDEPLPQSLLRGGKDPSVVFVRVTLTIAPNRR